MANKWWKFPLIIFVIFFRIPCVILISHQSKLCEARDMYCDREETNKCLMKYYLVNSTSCRDLAFNQISTAPISALGRVSVDAYYYTLSTHRQTGFNVTLSDIRWKQLKFRFKQDGNELKNTCREFYISENVVMMEDIFYDCIWSLQNYEGKAFFFEYEASDGTQSIYEKYAFRVPVARHINEITTNAMEWELFTYVNIETNGFGLTTFVVYWQPMPAKFLVNSYNVSVFINDTGTVEYVSSDIVQCSEQQNKCQFVYNKWYGSVLFSISPICINRTMECSTTRTQFFLLGGESTKPLLICIVSITIMIPVLLYLLFLLRNYIMYKSSLWVRSPPKLLIIYSPSTSCHMDVVFALAKYLKTHCNVEPLVDEWEIPLTESKDPFKWCNESFKSADYVMIVASPYHKHLRLASSVYHNVDVLLLRLLCERLTTRGSKTQYFTLHLPYTTDQDVPSEAVNLRGFSFPADLDKMLAFLHHEWRLPECLSLPFRGGRQDLAVSGKEVTCSVQQALADLKKNGPFYRRMEVQQRTNAGNNSQLSDQSNTCLEHHRTDCCEFYSHGMRNKSTLMELAKVTFSEFPGPLDNLALSGDEETESLVCSDKLSLAAGHPINLDTLNL